MTADDLSPSEKLVLKVLDSEGQSDVATIRQATGLPERTMYWALRDLRDRGLVDHSTAENGDARRTVYEPTER